jgi:hypothetical protein
VRPSSSNPDPTLSELDPGKREAIQLALEEGLDTLLMDESEGRREALRRQSQVTGTIAVLEKAAQHGLAVPAPFFHIFICSRPWTLNLSRNTVVAKSPSCRRCSLAHFREMETCARKMRKQPYQIAPIPCSPLLLSEDIQAIQPIRHLSDLGGREI